MTDFQAFDKIPPAPTGAIWMCSACGKTSTTRYGLGDTSCVTWGVLVEEASIVRDGDSVHAEAWKETP